MKQNIVKDLTRSKKESAKAICILSKKMGLTQADLEDIKSLAAEMIREPDRALLPDRLESLTFERTPARCRRR